MSRTTFTIWFIAVYLTLTVFLLILSMQAAGGQLIYTLDDPYIHLAVAENILLGGYGVNFPETSSPSSSILYPFLLSATLLAGFGEWGPLAISVAANVLSLLYAGPLLFHCCIGTGPAARFLFLVLPPLFLLATNTIALPMTGMEHPLHVLAVILVVSGLVRLGKTGDAPVRLGVGALLAPLVRFEGFALSLAVIAALFFIRKGRIALVLAALLCAAVAAYVMLMQSMGLPLIPSSVLVKSSVTANAYDSSFSSTLIETVRNTLSSMNSRWGVVFALGCALLIPICFAGVQTSLAAACTVVMLAAHISFGRYGWFGRYEVYAHVGLLLAIASCYAPAFLAGPKSRRVLLIPLLLLVMATPYLQTTMRTPAASRNVYQQQYQMHRFATEFFPEVVAVNDLGWVSYRNDLFVLDLWGLGSEEARQAASQDGRTAEFMRDMTAKNGVKYAMIYDKWFAGQVPREWCRIAELRTSRVTAAFGEVAFYLIDRDLETNMGAALTAFGGSLPEGAHLSIQGCDDA
ncbi:MAG: hypothetical protein AAGF79_05160 [Pseudomonadota bacterium]